MKKSTKFITPQKFLRAQNKTYNTYLLNVKEPYLDYEKIRSKMLITREDIDNQINLVLEMINSFAKYEKEKPELKNDMAFYLVGYAFSFSLLFLVCNTFFKLPINMGIYLIAYLTTYLSTIFNQHPYLKYYFKAKFHGLTKEKLETYEEELEKLFLENYTRSNEENLSINARELLENKNEAFKLENKILGNDLVMSRNAAIWQITAFQENANYLKKALSLPDFSKLAKDIITLRKLLQNLSLAGEKEKIKIALLIDETLDEIYNLYDKCEKNDILTRRKEKGYEKN